MSRRRRAEVEEDEDDDLEGGDDDENEEDEENNDSAENDDDDDDEEEASINCGKDNHRQDNPEHAEKGEKNSNKEDFVPPQDAQRTENTTKEERITSLQPHEQTSSSQSEKRKKDRNNYRKDRNADEGEDPNKNPETEQTEDANHKKESHSPPKGNKNNEKVKEGRGADKKDPTLVPKTGRFFLHDDREAGNSRNYKDKEGEFREKRGGFRSSKRANDNELDWKHDKYEELIKQEDSVNSSEVDKARTNGTKLSRPLSYSSTRSSAAHKEFKHGPPKEDTGKVHYKEPRKDREGGRTSAFKSSNKAADITRPQDPAALQAPVSLKAIESHIVYRAAAAATEISGESLPAPPPGLQENAPLNPSARSFKPSPRASQSRATRATPIAPMIDGVLPSANKDSKSKTSNGQDVKQDQPDQSVGSDVSALPLQSTLPPGQVKLIAPAIQSQQQQQHQVAPSAYGWSPTPAGYPVTGAPQYNQVSVDQYGAPMPIPVPGHVVYPGIQSSANYPVYSGHNYPVNMAIPGGVPVTMVDGTVWYPEPTAAMEGIQGTVYYPPVSQASGGIISTAAGMSISVPAPSGARPAPVVREPDRSAATTATTATINK